MTSESTTARTYRFSPLDRTGWLLGLGGTQCVALALGVAAAGALLEAGAPAPVVLVPAMVAVVFAFGAVDGRPVHEWTPVVLRHAVLRLSGRHRWSAEIPLIGACDHERQPDLPPFLAGLSIVDAGPLPGAATQTGAVGVGVVRDRQYRTVSASLRIAGREFSLLERAEQDRLVQLWGDALSGFCTERGAVSRVRLTEWAAPAGLADHERHLAIAAARARSPEDLEAYRELLGDAGPFATRHDILVTVTVDERRVRGRRSPEQDSTQAAIAVLVEEVRLLVGRLEGAGLGVEPPLSPVQLAETVRMRIDPACMAMLSTRASALGVLAGVVSRYNWGPLATEAGWSRLRADGAVHRSFWVSEWPRLHVPANWLEPLLLHAGGVRTFCVDLVPVAPSRSQRRVDRDATRLAADEEQRARGGFRIGARHRRVEAAVAEREAELVAGYAELEFAGFLTVTAAGEEELRRSCAELEQAAAQAGLDARALDGRHDLGFTCSLPIGRGLVTRRWL